MFSVVIQAGGESSRMGRDKALMEFLGRPLISRIVARMAPIANEIIVTTNRPGDYGFLGLPLFPDLRPGCGSLGGLYTALESAKNPFVAVVACDMPFASTEIFQYALRRIIKDNADVVIPFSGDGLEPLHAVYRRLICLPAIESALDTGQMRMISWFPQVSVRTLASEETAALDPHGLAFWNLNTIDEFASAEARARELD